jgi:hypothetical protein
MLNVLGQEWYTDDKSRCMEVESQQPLNLSAPEGTKVQYDEARDKGILDGEMNHHSLTV